MTGYEVNLEASVLFLLIGVALGILFLVLKTIRIALGFGRIAEAVLDMIFCLATAVTIFLCALAYDSGRLRFFQLLLHIIGAAAVIISLGPFVQAISRKIKHFFLRLHSFIRLRLRKISGRLHKKKSKKSKKKVKLEVSGRKKNKKDRIKQKEKRKST